MTAETVAWTVLLFALCGASVTGLIIGGRWIMRRVDVPAEVAVFANAITAENADVAGPDAEVDALLALAQIEDEIVAALAPLREAS